MEMVRPALSFIFSSLFNRLKRAESARRHGKD